MAKVYNKHTAPIVTSTGVTIQPGETIDNYDDTNNHLSADPFVKAGWLVVGKDADAAAAEAQKADNVSALQAQVEDLNAQIRTLQDSNTQTVGKLNDEIKAKDAEIKELKAAAKKADK